MYSIWIWTTSLLRAKNAVELGGMHVIGVECHESGRIDRRLLGRAGRQGDPGSGRFFIAADDPLLVRFAPSLSARMQRMPRSPRIFPPACSPPSAAEAAAFTARRRMLLHDRWMDEMGTMLG